MKLRTFLCLILALTALPLYAQFPPLDKPDTGAAELSSHAAHLLRLIDPKSTVSAARKETSAIAAHELRNQLLMLRERAAGLPEADAKRLEPMLRKIEKEIDLLRRSRSIPAVPNVDAALGTFSGTVKNAATMAGMQSYLTIISEDWWYVTSFDTNADGTYTSPALDPGNYYILARADGFLPQYYNGVNCFPCNGTVSPITVGDGSQTAGIDFALEAGARISGTVTEAGSGTPVTSAWVDVYYSPNYTASWGYTDASGNYVTFDGIRSGTYWARTDAASPYIDEAYDDYPCFGYCNVTLSTPIETVAPNPTTNIDFALSVGGVISGTVTDSSSGAAVTDGEINLFTSSGAYLTWIWIDGDGNFASPGLPSGDYYARAAGYGYVPELYQNQPCLNCPVTSGTPITVAAPAATPAIDFALDRGSVISGRVIAAGVGTPLYRYIDIADAAGNPILYTSAWNDGWYDSYYGLPAGTYYVSTYYYNDGYVDELYENVLCLDGSCGPTSGTPITLSGALPATAGFALGQIFITPSHGAAAGGNTVVLVGYGFTPSTTFTIGGAPVLEPLFVSSSIVVAKAPALAAGSLYDVVATTDAVETTLTNGYFVDFTDVPGGGFQPWIEKLIRNGVTAGCGGGNYCPNANVTRAQMAIFLLKSKFGIAFVPDPATGAMFSDVAAGSFAAAWIERLATEGITGGCGGGRFCPNNSVTRAQMAVFLLTAKSGSGYAPPAATGNVFLDVPLGSFAASFIEQLAREGITAGCGGGNYCPNSAVGRAPMAVFLGKSFGLMHR